MKLSDYQWSRNPRGMHNQGPMNLERLQDQKMGFAKLVGVADEYINFSVDCMANNITPIIRIYRPEFSGVPMDATMERQFRNYLAAGVKWVEFYNEPNLGIEWRPGANFDPTNIPGVIAPLCENWLTWAEMVLEYDAYPGFINLSESVGGWEDTITWINQLLLYMFDNHFRRFLQILANGFWVNTHPYVFNHFYQQEAGGGELSARPPETQNHAEGGWHFEYPYDPISQRSDPGRTVWGGTPLAPQGDPNGLIATGLAWLERLQEMFGVGAVPVVGTEGGVFPFPKRNQPQQIDIRYPPVTWESHAHATVALFDWISFQAPPWMFGVALWKWDHYYTAEGGGPMPAADLLAATNPTLRDVPPIEALGDYSLLQDDAPPPPPPENIILEPPGPGPIHGQPTFHFVILAPDFDEDWFFEVGDVYFNRFRPTLMTIYEFINFLPRETSLAATVIATPDTVDFMNYQIANRWVDVFMDMIVVENAQQIAELLNTRVAAGRRFG